MLVTTGSASQTGITVAVGVVPTILVGIFGGAIVDRLGYKTSSIVSDILSGLSVAMIPLLHQTVGLAFWQLLALVFLGAVLDGPGRTARMALFADLAHGAGLDLDRANAGYQTTSRIAELLTPPLAGVLIAVIGASNLLWLNAASFVISTILIARFVPVIASGVTNAPLGGWRGYLDEVGEGFRFVFARPVLVWMTLSFAIGSLVAEPLYAVILPVYANQEWGSAVQLGFVFSALGAGSLIGNGLYVALSHRLSRGAMVRGTGAGVLGDDPVAGLVDRGGGRVRGRGGAGADQPDDDDRDAGAGSGRHAGSGVRGAGRPAGEHPADRDHGLRVPDVVAGVAGHADGVRDPQPGPAGADGDEQGAARHPACDSCEVGESG